MSQELRTLVFSGGGVSGISYIGVLQALEEQVQQKKVVLDIKSVLCVSVGSIFGLLYILGYTSDEMKSMIMSTDLKKLKDIKLANMSNGWGLDSGNKIMKFVEIMIVAKNISPKLSFQELYDRFGVDLQIYATNVNKHELECLSVTSHPQMSILEAIRLTISIPMLFTANRYHNDIYVDGAVINGYPIEYVDTNDLITTLGVKCNKTSINNAEHISNFESYIKNVVACLVASRNKTLPELHQARTVYIQNNVFNAVNFDLTNEMKQEYIDKGYEATMEFFNTDPLVEKVETVT